MSALTALEIRELTNFLKPFLEREYLDRVYPIGSLYFSATEVDPSELFGGTWERIKDRFLLSAGDTYAAGSTGGSADAVVVKHSHVFATLANAGKGYAYSTPPTSGSDYNSIVYTETLESGEDGTGKNMPPYLSVYVWKRIA